VTLILPAGMAGPAPRTSDCLRRMADELGPCPRGPTLAALAGRLERRGYGMLLLLAALCCCLPGPPGSGVVLSLPLLLLGTGMLAGRRQPWLPGWLGRRRLPPGPLRGLLRRAVPLLERLERRVRPRWICPHSPGSRPEIIQERVTGAAVVMLALLLALPTPLTNLPLAASVVILALGVLERDGLATLAGLAAAALAGTATLALTGGLLAGAGLLLG